ncbi:hypothetical protein RND81_10G189200 [Saponaria officinalis]|uniref:Integrase catalytic domain-containing protein n=1 Tax=Saponaria officinalis TaxID=3572 RepID=A0AAW1I4M4_SAPOF
MTEEINPTANMASQSKHIDSNDPLYFHPGDGATTVRMGQPLTGPQNYREWKREMEIFLALKRKLELVTEKVVKPTNDPIRASAWDACNNLVISWLLGSMDSLTRKSVMYYTNCITIWDDLEARFTKSNGAQKFRLNKATYETCQNKRSVSDYYTKLKALWDAIEALTEYPPMTSFPPELMALDKFMDKQNEERRLFQLLNGLDPKYSTLRSNMLMMSPLPTVEAAFAYVQQEENLAKQGQMTPMDCEAYALFSKGEHKFACPICRMDNHTEEQCWKMIGYPTGHPKNSRKQLGQSSEYKFQGNYKPQRSQGFKNKSNYPSSPGHSGGSCNTGADTDEEIDQAFASMITCNFVNMSENMWVIDSGASDHMSFSLKVMNQVRPLNHRLRITLPNGETTLVTHIGNLILKNGLKLINVLVVPAFRQNLMSVQRLVSDECCSITFLKRTCTIQDHKTLATKELGRASNGLYYFDNMMKVKEPMMTRAATTDAKFYNNCDSLDKIADSNYNLIANAGDNLLPSMNDKNFNYSVWHKRLRHLPMSKLKLVPEAHRDVQQWTQPPLCLACPMAKMTKSPFPTRITKTSSPFELIHIDIWRPYRIPYKGRYRGIIHQTSIAHRPQQNGVVERKHRHVLEVSRALRFHSGLSLHYWGDCVMTAAYLINRMPTTLLQNKTPYEVLYGKTPSLSHLKVFGCLVLASNPEHHKDKFKERAVPCVFLGYAQTQKGYKLQNLLNKQYFVSRDVAFYESVLPFSKFTKLNTITPIPNQFHSLENLSFLTDDTAKDSDNSFPSNTNSALIPQSTETVPPPAENVSTKTPPPVLRRGHRNIQRPLWTKDYETNIITRRDTPPPAQVINVIDTTVSDTFANFVSQLSDAPEPEDFYDAARKDEWI